MATVQTSTRSDSQDEIERQIEAMDLPGGPHGPFADMVRSQLQEQSESSGQWDEVLDYLREKDARGERLTDEDRATIQGLMSGGSEAIGNAATQRNQTNNSILQAMADREAGLVDPTLGKYQGDWTSKAAKGDARAKGMEMLAGEKLKGWMDPRVTDREKAMMEMSRRKQEMEQRASREATLSSLRDRGFGSGGDEIASMLGSQQETGNRRMLEDLGTRGQAVDRSLQATRDYGALGGQMRGETYAEGRAADIAQQSSRQNRQAYDQFAFGAQQGLNQDSWGRLLDQSRAKAGAAQDAYQGARDPWDFQMGGMGLQTGNRDPNSGLAQGLEAKIGSDEAKRAAEMMLPEDDGMFGLGIGPF